MLTELPRPFVRDDFPADLRRAAGHVTVLANTVVNTWPRRIGATRGHEVARDGIAELIDLFREFDTSMYPSALTAYRAVSVELVAASGSRTVPVTAPCAHEAVLAFAKRARHGMDALICEIRGVEPSSRLTDPGVLYDCINKFAALCWRFRRMFGTTQLLHRMRSQLEQECCRAAVARGYRSGPVAGVPVPNGRVEFQIARSDSLHSGCEPPHQQVIPSPPSTALVGRAPVPDVSVPLDEERSQPRPATSGVFRFVLSGDVCDVEGFGESGHLSRFKGLANIARLLRTPGRPVSLLELASNSPDHGSDGEALAVKRTFSAQPALDREARASIRKEIARLEYEVEEADNDVDRADSQRRLEVLRSHWTASTGLGGRPRDLNSIREKLRPMIRRRLSEVYAAMEKPGVGLRRVAVFLRNRIGCRAGNYVYTPEPGDPNWET